MYLDNLNKTEKTIADKAAYFETRRLELVEQMKQLDLEAAGLTNGNYVIKIDCSGERIYRKITKL